MPMINSLMNDEILKGFIMLKFIGKNFMNKMIIIIVITLLSFVLTNMSRVDPAESYVRRHARVPDQATIEKMREELGLNDSLLNQYGQWIKGVLHLDFGVSLVTGNPILEDFKFYSRSTLSIVGLALIFISGGTLFFGVLSALYENSPLDKVLQFLSLSGISIPNFFQGFALLYIVAFKLSLVPTIGDLSLRGLILPGLTMSIIPICHYSRFLRAHLIEELNKAYGLNFLSLGMKKWRIVRHALKNAIVPIVPLYMQNIGYLLLGSAVIESVFSIKGLGLYTVHAIVDRDYLVVTAFVLLSGVLFSLLSFITDLINMHMNRKVSGHYE